MKELVKRLKNEGFLRQSSGTKMSLVKTVEQERIRHRGYSNPWTYVNQHVGYNLLILSDSASRPLGANFVSMNDQRLLLGSYPHRTVEDLDESA